MIYFSDFSLPGGPTGDVVIAVQDFLSGTTTGVQTFTSPTISGLTPAAVLTLNGLHDPANDPSETPGLCFGLGVVSTTSDNWTLAFSRDNNASTSTFRGIQTNQMVTILTNTGSNAKAATGQTASGGLELNYISSNAVSLRSAFVAFAGADTSSVANRILLGTGTSAIDVNSVGFEPDVVIMVGAGGNASLTAGMRYSLGICVNDGSATQRCVMWAETSSLSDSRPFQQIRNDCAGGEISDTTGAVDYSLVMGSFDASGFSVTPSASAGSDQINYIALNFGGRQFKLVDFTTPTSTGNSTITGAGFTPSFALAVLTNLETVNNDPGGTTTDLQSGLSICLIGDDEQWSMSGRINAGEATTDTATQISNAAIMGASATDCDAILGSFVAWTSDGVTINYSAVQGTAKRGFILFVE